MKLNSNKRYATMNEVNRFGRIWKTIPSLKLGECWLVMHGSDGSLYMDNINGYVYLVCEDGTILKSDI